ncbi:MAG: heme ABC transporter permease [Rickettsiaceae bacterium]|nr:heme ABC transporter permease [Rickettsiaceae bacterium]
MLALLSPYNFHKISAPVALISGVLSLSLFAIGIYLAFFASPPDYQQGEFVRIMYIHVPSAWLSLGIYLFITLCSISTIVWNAEMSYIFAVAAAPIGACFSLITLVTGSIWGKPIWGTWWVWDARLTSMLILFLLYISYMIIVNSADSWKRAQRPASVIAIIGAINIPIVKFSVDIWNSLHQSATIFKAGGPSIDASMIKPLIVMFLACGFYFVAILMIRSENLINRRRKK